MTDVGRATALIRVLRTLLRNTKMIRTARTAPSQSDTWTSSMERRMNFDWSKVMSSCIPCGGFILATAALTRSATATVFSPDCRLTERPTASLAVEPCQGPLVLEAVLGLADVAQFDQSAVAIGDHQVIERFGRFELALGLDDIFGAGILDPSARDLAVLASQGHFDIIGGQRGCIHLCAVDPDAHLAGPAAADRHRPDAGIFSMSRFRTLSA